MAEEQEPNSPDDPIVREAKKRFKWCQEWERDARTVQAADQMFDAADADNHYQWPNQIYRERDDQNLPCLTINKTHQHNLQIINDAKQNKPSIKVRPTGNSATFEVAQVYESIFRHIEYISNAQVAYDTATRHQVVSGMGYWRVATEYVSSENFDQEIYIQRIKDPFSCYLDPDIEEFDGSDANFGFVFRDFRKEVFKSKYKRYAEKFGPSGPELYALANADEWLGEDKIRLCEYYWKEEKPDLLLAYDTEAGRKMALQSKIGPDLTKQLLAATDLNVRTRKVSVPQIKWNLIAGDRVVDSAEWPGIYIPLVRVPGEESVIDGKWDCKGHTRALKDPQRMYNYWTSSATQHVALQGKTPYIAAAQAIEGYETYWENANKEDYAILPYNALDDAGNEIPPPQRSVPPVMADAYLKGMEVTQRELMMVSGQWQAQMGEPGNERSGKAINERQRQGDNATYHFIDHLATAIRFTGKIILDLIPKIYDTDRVIQIVAKDGKSFALTIDPNAEKLYEEKKNHNNEVIERILNPQHEGAQFDVQSDVGPAYATQRQEAFNALTQIITEAPQIAMMIGDLLLRAADFPMADEAADRLKRMVPKDALGEGPSQAEQQMQQQIQGLQEALGKTVKKLAEYELRLTGKDELRTIDTYKAETDRLKVLCDALEKAQPESAEGGAPGFQAILQQLIQDALQTHITQVTAANEDDLASKAVNPNHEVPPVPGARKAQDGKWYVEHAPGQFAEVQ